MATCAVTGQLIGTDGVGIANATIRVRPVGGQFFGNAMLVPHAQSVTVDASGNFTLTLQQSLQVICSIQYPPNDTDAYKEITMALSVPATTTADFSSIVVTE
jgi:hypothetical protein